MKNLQRGLTVVEILISIAILAVLVSLTLPSFLRFRQKQALDNTTYGVISLLKDARTKTLAGLNNTNYSVRLEKEKAIVFPGVNYNENSTDNEFFVYEKPVVLDLVSPATFKQITFERLSGHTNDYGTISLSISSTQKNAILITSAGNISKN